MARLIRATLIIDHACSAMGYMAHRARAAAVLAFASDAVLDRFGDLSYGANEKYFPNAAFTRRGLSQWEKDAIDRYFPSPPARILVGAAGGGREALALAQMGYEVVAFEPVTRLAQSMARSGMEDSLPIMVYLGRFEELPWLKSLDGAGESTSIDDMTPFDAGIVGWGSFSHLFDDSHRLQLLRQYASVVNGPTLLSFLSRASEPRRPRTRLGALRRRLPGRNRLSGYDFTIEIGRFWAYSEDEIRDLAVRAGFSIEYADIENELTEASHVVLRPVTETESGGRASHQTAREVARQTPDSP